MQVVILAAGRGTRLGGLTQQMPKSLVQVANKPILEHILLSLPSEVSEVVLIVGYLSNKVKLHFGHSYHGLPIRYAAISQLNGTGGALWQVRGILKNGKFLVLNGDDFYHAKELAECLKHDLAFGLANAPAPSLKYISIEVGDRGQISGHSRPDITGASINIATGAYVLDHRIFDYDLARLANGEYGLPQTILKMAKLIPVKSVFMKRWHQINYSEDIFKIEQALKR